MRVLLVEDDLDFRDLLVTAAQKVAPEIEFVVCGSRDSAEESLGREGFDLIVLDQEIPTQDNAMDQAIEHGRHVFVRCRELCPGTPVTFLTGFAIEDMLELFQDEGAPRNIWGAGEEPMTRKFPKRDLDKIPDYLGGIATKLRTLNAIEVIGEGQTEVSESESRVLRNFAHQFDGTQITVSTLTGGLSGAHVVRCRVTDGTTAHRITAVGKLNNLAEIDDEVQRYDRDVVRLQGGFAPLVRTVRAGARNRGGAFYQLVEPESSALFQHINADPAGCGRVVPELERIETPWTEDSGTILTPMSKLRERVFGASDITLREALLSARSSTEGEGPQGAIDNVIDLAEGLEAKNIQTRWVTQHGDLHGSNVLIPPDSANPILIDYGEIGVGPGCLDAVTLELSLLFHPDAAGLLGAWPNSEQCGQWTDLDSFVGGCPLAHFVRGCRDWAYRSGGGPRAVYATALLVACKQLKYPDTDKDVVIRIAASAAMALRDSF